MQQPTQRRAQPGEHDLGLGVAEARVELDDPNPARRQREPGVEQAGKRCASPRHLVDRRLQHRREHLVDQPGRRPRQRRVGAHAAGVRPGVAVADALEVLRRRQRHDGRAVGHREQRHLRPVEVLLHHDPLAGTPRAPAAARSSVTTTPLPAASPSSLTTYGAPSSSSAARHLRLARTPTDRRSRHPGRRHDVLGERLGPLEPGRGSRRSEARDPGRPHRVGCPRDQRPLRPDHHQVDAQLVASAPTAAGSVTSSGRIGTSAAMPALPGAATTSVTAGRPQAADQGVLAGAAAHDEHLHDFQNSHQRRDPLPDSGAVVRAGVTAPRTGAGLRPAARTSSPRRRAHRRPMPSARCLVTRAVADRLTELRVVALEAGDVLHGPGERVDGGHQRPGRRRGPLVRDRDRDLALDHRQLDACRDRGQLAGLLVGIVDPVTSPRILRATGQQGVPVLEVHLGQLAGIPVLEGRLEPVKRVLERLAGIPADEEDVVAHRRRR